MRVMRKGFVAVVVVVLLSGFVVAGGYVQIDAQRACRCSSMARPSASRRRRSVVC